MTAQAAPATLYIVATPIGNLEDITARAVRVLREADLIAAEDTRHSRGLLTHFQIKTPMFSCHKFNEGKRGDFFITALREGRSVALISDAGTPCISDPGHRLVSLAAEEGISIVPVCGASAVAAALSVSGFDAARFTFLGFLPRGKDLAKFNFPSGTVAFYESPKRIKATLKVVSAKSSGALLCLCNDISKKFERVYRGTAEEILKRLLENPDSEKGEYTCVVSFPADLAPPEDTGPESVLSLESQLVDIMIKSDCNLKDAARELREKNGKLSKKEIYSAMLRLKGILKNSHGEEN